MIIKIFTGPLNYNIKNLYKEESAEFIIGVDQGCQLLLEAGIDIDLAIGDFDSVSKNIFDKIVEQSKKTIVLNSVKDYTDTFLAVKEALKIEHTEIQIYGGIGKRFDHTFANVNLLKLGNIKIINNDSIMYMLDPGTYEIMNKHKYISFFSIEDVVGLTLEGFKYPLKEVYLDTDNPLCISNEGEGNLSFTDGLLLVILQNEHEKRPQ